MSECISSFHPHPGPHMGTPPQAPVNPSAFLAAPLRVAGYPPKPFIAVYRASASWLGSKSGKSRTEPRYLAPCRERSRG